MIIKTKNDKEVLLRKLTFADFNALFDYLCKLSQETVQRFGPHTFDMQTISEVYAQSGNNTGYVAQDIETSEIIAYSIVRKGFLQHDSERLLSYGLYPDPETDCTLAPSVADKWQSQGIGNSLFRFILSDLKLNGFGRIILWGGVQADNYRAVNFYRKNGFSELGRFEYNGWNYDMILDIL